jgi:hypothetical protein
MTQTAWLQSIVGIYILPCLHIRTEVSIIEIAMTSFSPHPTEKKSIKLFTGMTNLCNPVYKPITLNIQFIIKENKKLKIVNLINTLTSTSPPSS